MTSEVGLTDVTLPVANPNFAAAAGRVRLGMLLDRVPPPPAKKPPPAPPPGPVPGPPDLMHEPELSGWLIVTLVATRVPVAVEPLAVTQSPSFTEDAETVTVLVKVVDEDQLTVTCPLWGFWTSIDDPVIAATVPVAPGNLEPAPPAPAPLVGLVAGVVFAACAAPPPHAPRMNAIAAPAARRPRTL